MFAYIIVYIMANSSQHFHLHIKLNVDADMTKHAHCVIL